MMFKLLIYVLLITLSISCNGQNDMSKMNDEYWKSKLSPEQYEVLRNKGTDKAFSGEYDKHFEEGNYKCAGCGEVLFSSETKYNSGCGWPAFYAPSENDKIKVELDKSHGMIREEIICNNCGGHLGHVFNDGPLPTGQRYCVNSTSLDFKKKD